MAGYTPKILGLFLDLNTEDTWNHSRDNINFRKSQDACSSQLSMYGYATLNSVLVDVYLAEVGGVEREPDI